MRANGILFLGLSQSYSQAIELTINSLSASMLILDPAKLTIASYMKLFAGEKSASYNPDTYVALLLASVPTMAVYIFCSRYIVSGITLGAVKE